MFDVPVSTLVSVILAFMLIIFFLLVLKTKPKKSEVHEMKETGWEIVNEIQLHLEKLAEEKELIDQKLEQMKAIEQTILKAKEEAIVLNDPMKAPAQEEKEAKKEIHFAVTKTPSQKQQIISLYNAGHAITEIAEQLHIPKGIVEVVVNMQKGKKQA